jgi:hypothetical protein
MMNKSLRARARESSHKRCYGFQTVRRFGDSGEDTPKPEVPKLQKKEPPFPADFEVDNREASNRVDRSHSVSKQGQSES